MKRCVLLWFGLLLAWETNAQLRHGPRLGLALATQTAGQFLQWSGLPKIGPIVGWSFDIPLRGQIGMRVEPMLMSKGSWARDAVTNTNTFTTLRYLELPLLLRLDMQPAEDGLFLTGGPIYGYWLNGRYRTVVDGQETVDLTYDLSQSGVQRTQWSMALGLGGQGKNWSWEVRGQSSVSPFDRLQKGQNVVFGIHLTYRLPRKPPDADEKEAPED